MHMYILFYHSFLPGDSPVPLLFVFLIISLWLTNWQASWVSGKLNIHGHHWVMHENKLDILCAKNKKHGKRREPFNDVNLWPWWYLRNGEIQKRERWASLYLTSIVLKLGDEWWNISFVPVISRKGLRRTLNVQETQFPPTALTTGSETHLTAVHQNITSCWSCLTVKLRNALICSSFSLPMMLSHH